MGNLELTPEELKFFETGGDANNIPDGYVEPQVEAPPAAMEPPQPAPVEAPKPDSKLEDGRKWVPYDALHEARQQNRELNENLRSQQDRVAKMEERFQVLLSKIAKEETPPIPDYKEDPVANLAFRAEQAEKQLKELGEQNAQIRNADAEQARLAAFASKVQVATADFMKTTPDYADAYAYVRGIRIQDLTDLGVPEEHIAKVIIEEEVGLSSAAMANGKNPAEVLYNIAKRYGYKQPVNPAPDANQSPDNKLRVIEGGMKVATPSAPGKPMSGDITLESLAQIDEDQFTKLVENDDWWAKNIRRA